MRTAVYNEPVTVTVADGETDSEAFLVHNTRFGSVQALGTPTGTTLNYLVSNNGEDFVTVKDDTGTALSNQTIGANGVVPMPTEVFHSKFCKLVLTEQSGADIELLVNLKG